MNESTLISDGSAPYIVCFIALQNPMWHRKFCQPTNSKQMVQGEQPATII